MRLQPITTGHTRAVTKDIAIQGYQIPQGVSERQLNVIISFHPY